MQTKKKEKIRLSIRYEAVETKEFDKRKNERKKYQTVTETSSADKKVTTISLAVGTIVKDKRR